MLICPPYCKFTSPRKVLYVFRFARKFVIQSRDYGRADKQEETLDVASNLLLQNVENLNSCHGVLAIREVTQFWLKNSIALNDDRRIGCGDRSVPRCVNKRSIFVLFTGSSNSPRLE